MINRIKQRLIRDHTHFQRFKEVLEEIRTDYFNGHITAEQRRQYEFEAHMDLAGKMNELDAMVQN